MKKVSPLFLWAILVGLSSLSAELPFEWSGFLDNRASLRLSSFEEGREVPMAESRLQLDLSKDYEYATLRLRGDVLNDASASSQSIDLIHGEGWLDIREANAIIYTPLEFLDIKIGRQILTWGTGDLLFINDLFSKDWASFLMGRSDEYLKAPSDALKLGFFSDLVNLDLVYLPRFMPDRFVTGQRVSYWNPSLGKISGQNAIVQADVPREAFKEDEWSLRLSKNILGKELAVYAYSGYWKSPGGSDLVTGLSIFPKLDVLGLSARGSVLGGIGNMEFGYYNSKDDKNGDLFQIKNSELRFLVGYERELGMDLTGSLQFYLERMLDYSAYSSNLAVGLHPRSEDRAVLSFRLSKLMMAQRLRLSVFSIMTLNDSDIHLRPRVSYQVSDELSLEAGANLFFGEDDWSFYGQFQKNNSIFASMRIGF